MALLNRVFSTPSQPTVAKRYRATWNGAVLAESADAVVFEGSYYFPLADVHGEHLRPSERHTTGPWKGVAGYYDVVIGDKVNRDAARYYPNPSPAWDRIKGRVAFWYDVEVEQLEA